MRMAALALLFAILAFGENRVDVAGKWNITIRMPGHVTMEQWNIQQKGTTVTGVAKGEHGEMPVAGDIEGQLLRVRVKDGAKEYKVRATVDGNSMDGSITFGVGDEHIWFARRPPAGK